ncbi:hypothetical protein EJ05DRAFT_725 [Pseudovirgaria hyperparasitica]|uniref:Pathogen-related protein n=1 Tax=Pseudovirgaria hyperparasitica TaxID=470096 RepID=A0A6A6WJZ5_9PEZI|nr:uncharacterized protein EJ05DRAFT_725 [Pseudovirgaria hyperparasitica]KAF2762417.1 hypothetical protein EJ05DRAFT_725 [Pseudovirgaria hyperparasitica]
MAAVDTTPAPSLPDYVTDPNAVLKDADARWRYGRAPDYTKTRKVFTETKKMNHTAGSLPALIEALVKNWEIEASFKTSLADWRTIDRPNYSFAINGGPPQSGEHMLAVGTYNAIIAPNEFYSPAASDFASSHKTFKRMMPTFAWEVVEVYAGPPQVAFRWRHWGVMRNDYVGFNDKGQKVTAKAHGGTIDIEGVTVATVDELLRLRKVETWFDPLDMFRQIAPKGIVNREVVPLRADDGAGASADTESPSQSHDGADIGAEGGVRVSSSSLSESSVDAQTQEQAEEQADAQEQEQEHIHPHEMEDAVQPVAGEAVAAHPASAETQQTHEEMSRVTPAECPFLMNRE